MSGSFILSSSVADCPSLRSPLMAKSLPLFLFLLLSLSIVVHSHREFMTCEMALKGGDGFQCAGVSQSQNVDKIMRPLCNSYKLISEKFRWAGYCGVKFSRKQNPSGSYEWKREGVNFFVVMNEQMRSAVWTPEGTEIIWMCKGENCDKNITKEDALIGGGVPFGMCNNGKEPVFIQMTGHNDAVACRVAFSPSGEVKYDMIDVKRADFYRNYAKCEKDSDERIVVTCIGANCETQFTRESASELCGEEKRASPAEQLKVVLILLYILLLVCILILVNMVVTRVCTFIVARGKEPKMKRKKEPTSTFYIDRPVHQSTERLKTTELSNKPPATGDSTDPMEALPQDNCIDNSIVGLSANRTLSTLSQASCTA